MLVAAWYELLSCTQSGGIRHYSAKRIHSSAFTHTWTWVTSHDTVPAFAAITASTPLGRLPTRATSMFMESLTRTLDENLAHSLCSHSFIFWTFPLGCQRGVCVKKGIYEENIGGYQNLELMKDSRCLLVPGLVIAACFTSLHWTLCAAPGHVRFGFSCSAMKTCSCLITVLQLIWRPCDVWSSAAIAKGWWPVTCALRSSTSWLRWCHSHSLPLCCNTPNHDCEIFSCEEISRLHRRHLITVPRWNSPSS